MKSPFPGMDPYVEPHCPGVYTLLASMVTGQLNQLLPDGLVAEPEERASAESGNDLRFIRKRGGFDVNHDRGSPSYGLAVDVEPITERSICISDHEEERQVTAIEFISPLKKKGKGLEEYLRRRRGLMASVHVVEVDLVRQGDWRALMVPDLCPAEAVTPYRVTIRAAGQRTPHLYPISLRQPLPSITIPLRPGDKRLDLALQPLLDQAYESGRYGRTIDYSRPPDPPLDEDDAAWAETLLKRPRQTS